MKNLDRPMKLRNSDASSFRVSGKAVATDAEIM
jgi:hypothetical protein